MKRILAIFLLLISLCPIALADREVYVKLDTKDRGVCSERLGFGYITFQYQSTTGNYAHVSVSVENITQNPPLSILIFRKDFPESSLKRNKPKIVFEKKYPGEKGNRSVQGCGQGTSLWNVITPNETETVCTIDVPLTSPKKIEIPFYIAKYKPKDLTKKGKENISYTILEEHTFSFTIEVEGWSENDPVYLKTKKEVDSFVESLNGVKFCDNSLHTPNLKIQQRKYRDVQENLISEITTIFEDNGHWLSTDPPHIAYSGLLHKVKRIDLDSYNRDCGKHERKKKTTVKTTNTHSCGYCGMSDQQLFYKLDNTYQLLYSGKISKDSAVKTAKAIYACYQSNKNRRAGSSYSAKISNYYNRIVNY